MNIETPTHSRYILQPLALPVFKSFQIKLCQKLVAWQGQDVGQRLSKQIFLCTTWKQVNSEVINISKKRGFLTSNSDLICEASFPHCLIHKWSVIEHSRLSIHEDSSEGNVLTEAMQGTQKLISQKKNTEAAV